MTIGIDASRANIKKKTGTEWYSFYLIEELKKIIPAEHKVILYSKEPLNEELGKLPANWKNKVLNWPPKFLWTQMRMSLEMLKFWSRPKILFVPAHTIPLIHPKKTILVTHDIGFEKMRELYGDKNIGYKNNIYRSLLKFLIRFVTLGQYGTTELDYHRWAMRFAVRHAHHIITISNFSKQEIADFYDFPEKKISVVYNGFDHKLYQPLENLESDKNKNILEKYRINSPYILFIGRLEQKKNIPRLIEAFSTLKHKYDLQHKLVLIGSPGFKYEEIEANVFEYKLENDVIEPGYVDQEDMNFLMNMADLFVLPSLYEGFGIPILEAMSAGTPVACSHIPPLREIGGNAAQYFDPMRVSDIAEQINKVLTDTDLQSELKVAGLKQVKKFSHEKCARQTWNIISKV